MAFVTKSLIVGSNINPPSGHSQLTTSPGITGVDITETTTLSLAASGFVGATQSAGFDALFTDIETAIDAYIGTDLGVDTSGNSVDYVATVQRIELSDNNDLYLNDATRNVAVVVNILIRIY